MYKKTADSHANQARTASHATKPFGTGRIDVLPPEARPEEVVYQDLKAQVFALRDQLAALHEEARFINDRLKMKMPFEEYQRMEMHRKVLADQSQATQGALSELRALANRVAQESWRSVFWANAKAMLAPEQYKAISQAATAMLGRYPTEFERGRNEMSEKQKQKVRDDANRRERWNRYQATKEKKQHVEATGDDNVGSFPAYYRVNR
jgi:hypothetical protein